tara:strand:- start:801 stop:1019 length:219 start_codon:yes stop_codon:yes gene_type:complete
MKKEFKVEVVAESALSTFFLGSAKLPIKKIEAVMNRYGSEGWDLAFQFTEARRVGWWSREALVITFSRDLKK